MSNPIRITITGRLGSGKTVVGKKLAEKYNLKYYSTGKIQREIAAKLGLSTLEMNLYAENNREIDDKIDNFNKELGIREEDLLVDSRMGWHFIDQAFKIFLKVDHRISAERIMSDASRQSENYQNIDQAIESIIDREESERSRYQKLYGVDLYDYSNYHLVVDTTRLTPEEITTLIDGYWKKFRAGEDIHAVLD